MDAMKAKEETTGTSRQAGVDGSTSRVEEHHSFERRLIYIMVNGLCKMDHKSRDVFRNSKCNKTSELFEKKRKLFYV